jgi:hypothetical protein
VRHVVVAALLVTTAAHADPATRAKKIADDAREQRATQRSFGWFLVGSGIGLGAIAGGFAWLSSYNNTAIKNGESSGSDYLNAGTRGQELNDAAWSFAIAGVVSIAIGVPLVLRNGELAIVPAPAGTVGVGIAGRL